MKKRELLAALAVVAAGMLGSSRADAFPLTLTSATGTITTTAHYGATGATTSNTAAKATVTLSRIINVLSNEVVLDLGSAPSGLQIALDPYSGTLFLTNSSGFFYDIEGNGLGSFRIREVATTFKTSSTTPVSEKDSIIVDLQFHGRAPNGESFEFDLRGYATMTYVLGAGGMGKVSLTAKGIAGYGEINSSDSGVARGGFKASGSGTPEWVGPLSVGWWNF